MTKKVFFYRFAGFILIAISAIPLYALTVNVLLFFNLIPQDLRDTAFGHEMTFKAVVVGCGCLVLGFAGIFPKESWRHVLYFSPAYAPSLYAIIHTMTQA